MAVEIKVLQPDPDAQKKDGRESIFQRQFATPPPPKLEAINVNGQVITQETPPADPGQPETI